ncbi:hypothetical protein SESBI_11735 [Sesbania bispinosa]|nr:hypothetical protein SESBI_11735 [Sesbania bispinosa]
MLGSVRRFQVFKERPVKANAEQTTEDSRIDHDVDNDAIHAASNDGTCETRASFMSSSRNSVRRRNFISHSRQYVGSMNIKSNLAFDKNQPASGKVTKLASEADYCNEIENDSTEQSTNVLVLVKSDEEKQINTSFSMDGSIQSDDFLIAWWFYLIQVLHEN